MPLPQALAARLAKRGIIKNASQGKETDPETNNSVQEEIIAEDYDDASRLEDNVRPIPAPPPPQKVDIYKGWFTCPNKWNVYHECSPACQDYWAEKRRLDEDYERARRKMLLKYTLPVHWQEVLDVGLGRYYYWNTETNLVSWFPPGHSKCRLSPSAAVLRKTMKEERTRREEEEKEARRKNKRRVGSDGEDEVEDEDEEEEEEERFDNKRGREGGENNRRSRNKVSIAKSNDDGDSDSGVESPDDAIAIPSKERFSSRNQRTSSSRSRRGEKESERARDREKRGTRRGRQGGDSDALDPMDPAAYSDCPRGSWSSGLPEKDEATTGVDTTVTGPLFQMRPYPNPGAVLKANSRNIGPKKPS